MHSFYEQLRLLVLLQFGKTSFVRSYQFSGFSYFFGHINQAVLHCLLKEYHENYRNPYILNCNLDVYDLKGVSLLALRDNISNGIFRSLPCITFFVYIFLIVSYVDLIGFSAGFVKVPESSDTSQLGNKSFHFLTDTHLFCVQS